MLTPEQLQQLLAFIKEHKRLPEKLTDPNELFFAWHDLNDKYQDVNESLTAEESYQLAQVYESYVAALKQKNAAANTTVYENKIRWFYHDAAHKGKIPQAVLWMQNRQLLRFEHCREFIFGFIQSNDAEKITIAKTMLVQLAQDFAKAAQNLPTEKWEIPVYRDTCNALIVYTKDLLNIPVPGRKSKYAKLSEDQETANAILSAIKDLPYPPLLEFLSSVHEQRREFVQAAKYYASYLIETLTDKTKLDDIDAKFTGFSATEDANEQSLIKYYKALVYLAFFKKNKNDLEKIKAILTYCDDVKAQFTSQQQGTIDRKMAKVHCAYAVLIDGQKNNANDFELFKLSNEYFEKAKLHYPLAYLEQVKVRLSKQGDLAWQFFRLPNLDFDYKVNQLKKYGLWDPEELEFKGTLNTYRCTLKTMFMALINAPTSLTDLILIADGCDSRQNGEWITDEVKMHAKEINAKFPSLQWTWTESTARTLYKYALLMGAQEAIKPFLYWHMNTTPRDKSTPRDDLPKGINSLFRAYFERSTSDENIRDALYIAATTPTQHPKTKHMCSKNAQAGIYLAQVYFLLLGRTTYTILDNKKEKEDRHNQLRNKIRTYIQANPNLYAVALAEAKTQVNSLNTTTQQKVALNLELSSLMRSQSSATPLIGKVTDFFAAAAAVIPIRPSESAMSRDATEITALQTRVTELTDIHAELQARKKMLEHSNSREGFVFTLGDPHNFLEGHEHHLTYFLDPSFSFNAKIQRLTQECGWQSVVSALRIKLTNFPGKIPIGTLMVLLGDVYASQYADLAKELLTFIDPTKHFSGFKWSWHDKYAVPVYKAALFNCGDLTAASRLLMCYENGLAKGGLAAYVERLVREFVQMPQRLAPQGLDIIYGLELAAMRPLSDNETYDHAIQIAKLFFCFFSDLRKKHCTAKGEKQKNDENCKKAEAFLPQINPSKLEIDARRILDKYNFNVVSHFCDWMTEIQPKLTPSLAGLTPSFDTIKEQLEEKIIALQKEIEKLEAEIIPQQQSLKL